jgi:MFS family permease
MNKTNNVAILILTGIAALTIAVGIGRFSYTPILPYMISELNLTTTEAGLIASSNYLGYLLGSLIPIFPQFPKNIRSIFIYSIFISIISLFAMGLTNTFEVFILIRFIHGIFSAFVLILGTSLIVSHVQKKGKIFLGTAHFSGVGLGMALSAIVVSYLGFLNFTWDELWFSIGILAIMLSFQIIKFTPIQKAEVKYNLKSKNKTSLGFSLITISYGLYGFGYVAFGTFISTMSRLTPGLEKTEPYVWFVVGVTGIPSVFFWNWFGSKIGNDIGLFLANLILGLGVLFSVLINNEFGIFISCILFGLSFVPITSMCLLEGQKRFSGSFIVSTAILTFSFSIGQMIGPYLSGLLTDYYGSFFFSMIISGIVLIFGSLLMINPKRFLNI